MWQLQFTNNDDIWLPINQNGMPELQSDFDSESLAIQYRDMLIAEYRFAIDGMRIIQLS